MALNPDQFKFIYQQQDNTHGLEALQHSPVDNELDNVGWMQWDDHSGEIQHIMVNHDRRREGIGTALWNRAQSLASERNITAPVHSKSRTKEGDAWAKSFGQPIPRRVLTEYDRGPKGVNLPYDKFETLD
jgi:hypothetical protein